MDDTIRGDSPYDVELEESSDVEPEDSSDVESEDSSDDDLMDNNGALDDLEDIDLFGAKDQENRETTK